MPGVKQRTYSAQASGAKGFMPALPEPIFAGSTDQGSLPIMRSGTGAGRMRKNQCQ